MSDSGKSNSSKSVIKKKRKKKKEDKNEILWNTASASHH